MQTERLHTRAEWLRVHGRYRETLYAYTVPLWTRQPATAFAVPWRLWVYCWSMVPAVVNTLVRWAPFLVGLWWQQAGSLAVIERQLSEAPALIGLGAARLTADPAHSLLLLTAAWFPLGLLAFLFLVAVAWRRFMIPGWYPLWSWIWMVPWSALQRLWDWWGYTGPSYAEVMEQIDRPTPLPNLEAPDWVDHQMAREARALGLDWVPRRLRPKGDSVHAG